MGRMTPPPDRSGDPTAVRIEPSPRWVRGWVGEVAVVDSRRALLFWEPTLPVPHYAFPVADVRTDLLTATTAAVRPHRFFGPHGTVTEVFDVAVGDRPRPAAAWVRDDPVLAGHLVFSWRPGSLDRWTEEDEEVFAHPRDPYSRVDALSSSRHVQVSVDGQVVADSRSPVLLFETGLPVRSYFPVEDVRVDALTEVRHATVCPYKGTADRYFSLPGLDRVGWCYTSPVPAVGAIAGRIAFYDEFVDVTVDGRPQPRPRSPFSRGRP